MILINLLPQEYRRKNRTPLRFTVGVCVAVAVNCSMVAWWAWLAFGVRAEVESELAVHTDTMDSISPQIAYHRSLERENALYLSRESTLAGITSNRMSWAQKIDQLIDVVNRGGDGEKYLVWFNDLTVEQLADTRRNTYGGIRASGHSGNPNFAHVANFLEDLEGSPFAVDFLPPAPAEVWSFPLDLDLLAPEDRRKANEAAAALADATVTEEDAVEGEESSDE
jgi:hypothetical protein